MEVFAIVSNTIRSIAAANASVNISLFGVGSLSWPMMLGVVTGNILTAQRKNQIKFLLSNESKYLTSNRNKYYDLQKIHCGLFERKQAIFY